MNAAVNAVWLPLQRHFGRQRLRKIFLGAIPFVVLLTLWAMNTAFGWLPPVFIPDMMAVIEARTGGAT